ncbi:MAG: M28 family peptidase [Ignavibacteriota bacterium]
MTRWMHAAPLLAALACTAQQFPAPSKVVFSQLSPAVIQSRLNVVPAGLRIVSRPSKTYSATLDVTAIAISNSPCGAPRRPISSAHWPVRPTARLWWEATSIHRGGDGSGGRLECAALLPSLYQSLKDQPRRHRFVFVEFSAEEEGLIGSKAFVSHLKREDAKRIHAMINLECLGLGAPEVWTSRANRALTRRLRGRCQHAAGAGRGA